MTAKPKAFFSYARDPDEAVNDRLKRLCSRLQSAIIQQLGDKHFSVFLDTSEIKYGSDWKQHIRSAVSESTFFFAVISPLYLNSRVCRLEFETFLEREFELVGAGSRQLIFPLLFRDDRRLESESEQKRDSFVDVLTEILATRQCANIRLLSEDASESTWREVDRICKEIAQEITDKFRQLNTSAYPLSDAIDNLDSKIKMYDQYEELCQKKALTNLFRIRQELPVNQDRRLFLLKSRIVLSNECSVPFGWYWFRDLDLSGFCSLLSKLIRDRRDDVRAAAVAILGAIKDPKTLGLLWESARDHEANVRRATAKALIGNTHSRSLELLRKLGRDSDSNVSDAASETIEEIRDANSISVLNSFVDDHEMSKQSRLSAERAIDAIQGLNQLSVVNKLEAVVKQLAEVHDPIVLQILRFLMSKENNESVRRAAFHCVSNYRVDGAQRMLREMITDADAEIRVAALNAIAAFQDTSDKIIIHRLTQDESASVRKSAVVAISTFDVFYDSDLLRSMMKNEQTSDVLAAIVTTLGREDRTDDLVMMRETFREKQNGDWARQAALDVIARSGNVHDSSLLRSVVKDDEEAVSMRVAAIEALAKLNDDTNPRFLREIVSQSSVNAAKQNDDAWLALRKSAVESLAQSPIHYERGFFLSLAMSDSEDGEIRQVALAALSSDSDFDCKDLARKLAFDSDEYVRLATTDILATGLEIADLRILCMLAVDEDPFVRHAAENALSDLDIEAVRFALHLLASDEDERDQDIQIKATGILCQLDDHNTIEKWFNENTRWLSDDVLCFVDEFLYGPRSDWLQSDKKFPLSYIEAIKND